jgi:hypothetical protein
MGTTHSTTGERYPQCTTCNNPAIVRSTHKTPNGIQFSTPLCEKHYTPPQQIQSPKTLDEETFSDKSKTEFELITTPADTTFISDTIITIDHGDGSQTKITKPV